YFVERIGGEHVDVMVMVPPGFSPATYEPKPEQLQALSEAHAYVRIRVPFEEAWMERIASANEDMLIIDESAGIERIGGKDPHIWLSPQLVEV
ncbi:MAG: zinc ABC transporter substrate-binding protein, partial [Anaerolineae bacterium]|nr:zinc ABC transporter substrate-binding protein [Anaerolineae bacterium]